MKTLQPTVILYGPQGSGKTTATQQVIAPYGCAQTGREWNEKLPLTPGALHLTNVVPRQWPEGAVVLRMPGAV